MTNLEVDVMEGDEFTVAINGGTVYQIRSDTYRLVMFQWVGQWINMRWLIDTPRLDLPTFTRYCEGCGLTVKHVKPEPKVETIKPPEFACRCVASGKVRFYTTQDGRDKCVQSAKTWQAVRIDWGAK